jgi:cysteinyl-tRNA synthetase
MSDIEAELKEQLEKNNFFKIKEMCEKVGEEVLRSGTTQGHFMAFVGCLSIRQVERKMKNFEEQLRNRDNAKDTISQRNKEFQKEMKYVKDKYRNSIKAAKKIQKDIFEDVDLVKRAEIPLEMIIKGEL